MPRADASSVRRTASTVNGLTDWHWWARAPARQNGGEPPEVDVDIETVIWSILGLIVAVGGVLLAAALWSIVRAPRR